MSGLSLIVSCDANANFVGKFDRRDRLNALISLRPKSNQHGRRKPSEQFRVRAKIVLDQHEPFT